MPTDKELKVRELLLGGEVCKVCEKRLVKKPFSCCGGCFSKLLQVRLEDVPQIWDATSFGSLEG